MKAEKKQSPTLEEAFEKLDLTIAKMEEEQISLEDAFAAYQEGMKLLKYCNETIDHVEKKVLIMEENGELHEF